MSKQLIESILSGNMLEANDMVEAKMAEIRERKMYEMKRMYQAEAMGGYSSAQIKADLESGRKRKASDVLGLSPYDKAQKDKKEREAKTGKASKPQAKSKPEAKPEAKPKAPEKKKVKPKVAKAKKPKIKKTGGMLQRLKQKIADHKPAAPGSGVLKVAKAIGSTAVQAAKNVGTELGRIGSSNLN